MRKIFFGLFLILIIIVVVNAQSTYKIGTGIADLTGPAARANMMGMADPSQIAHGIQTRLFARAFAFSDLSERTKMVFISADIAFVPNSLKRGMLERLEAHFGDKRYNLENVMISATHTHSGPGGYSKYVIFDFTSLGFIERNWQTIVEGLANAVIRADNNLIQGELSMSIGELLHSNVNRSPWSYPFNKDAGDYEYNVDKEMTLLSFFSSSGSPLGFIDWFAVHGTSMNNTNELISGDNKGFASWYVERQLNPAAFPGEGKFVAAFAQSNEGDVSPNTQGAMCQSTGGPCNERHSTCPNGQNKYCYAFGPGKDMTESCKIIGMNQVVAAQKLYNQVNSSNAVPIRGDLRYRHVLLDFEHIQVSPQFSYTGNWSTTCPSALGLSFAGGTTDGPGGVENLIQGVNYTGQAPRLTFLAHLLSKPSPQQIACHYPKPVFFNTGELHIPDDHPWEPSVIPLQMFQIGQLYIIAVPGEFTTMSGRRLRNQVAKVIAQNGGPADAHVVIAGLANEYTHYVATPEEYQQQRYEAASTLYGPETLPAYLQEFSKLALSLVTNTSAPQSAPVPANNFTGKIWPEWSHDTHPLLKPYGTVLTDVQSSYQAGDTATVVFVGASPDNNYKVGSTYLAVQKQNSTGQWQDMLHDSDWETIFRWNRPSNLEHHSEITIHWNIDKYTPPGTYRIQYYGDAKAKGGALTPFSGTSSSFQVQSSLYENARASQDISRAEFREVTIRSIQEWHSTVEQFLDA